MNNAPVFQIDDITWNDLDLDVVYEKLNSASSSVGQEYLKSSLKELQLSDAVLKERSSISDYVRDDPSLTGKLRKIFKDLGRTKKVSFLDYIFRLNELKTGSNLRHYLLILLLICSIVMVFVKPVVGIVAIIVMFAVNIATYFAEKGKVEGYFICLKYLAAMVVAANKISALKLDQTPLEAHAARLKELAGVFASVKRGSWLITNSVSGSLVDVIMDYIRMLFHVDLIKFNNMSGFAMQHPDEIGSLYRTLGEIELCMCISEYRKNLPFYCIPEFSSSAEHELSFEEICHPLISDPVGNSLDAKGSVLLTGSNASGKSTFLKSISLNQIFAQTIDTCLAQSFRTSFYKVMSSMALKDNILNNESYFVVEVKSLKRIFDELGEVPLLVFVDEVLRGTNTKERIAASSVILRRLSQSNALVFAATHDIELTQILKEDMANYHFSESVDDRQVSFDYKIKEGPSTSRNAIRLLEVFGFDSDLVQEARRLADS